MTPADKRAAIDQLLTELTQKISEYHICLNKEEGFTVRKKVRTRLKEIEKEIADLKAITPYFIPHITVSESERSV
jgi:hypothetical protein